MNLIIVKDLVKEILTAEPETRDNDNLLVLKVWKKQQPLLSEKDLSFWTFAIDFKNGKFASTESVRRVRQKMQEEHAELRGKKYALRHAEQTNVKNQLKNM